MCGFAAIFAHAPDAAPADRDALDRVRDTMRKRGPDAAGTWLSPDGRAGLAHRRLSILDLSDAGAQPMVDQDLAIAFNGEIYNFQALRDELEQAGTRFRSHSDTEVVLALYRRDGEAMLGRLRGMFALAIWDGRRQGMLLARDGLGIKPLYVSEKGGVLRAASQVKALLAGGGVDTSPDPAGHVGFFLWGHVPEPHTLYRGIRALPPGSWLWRDRNGGQRQGRFFDLGDTLRGAGGEPPASLRDALLESVRHHLVADVPVGLFLSAGLDSTTLCALASEAGGAGRLKTVTLAFEELRGGPGDEAPLAERVAGHYRTDHATLTVAGREFADVRDTLLADMDQPSIDGVNVWFVARAARAAGLKVALSGLGGDELFAGYDNFRRIPALTRRLAPLAAVPGLGRGFRWATAGWIGRFTSPKAAGILELGGNTGDAYLLRRGLFMPWELPGLIGADMTRAGLAELRPRQVLAEAQRGFQSDRLAISALEMQFYMRNQLLRDADWAGMAHSLEIRVPLVDTVLLSQVRALIQTGNAPSKADMAASARPTLPDGVLNRPKTGFFIPVAQWLGETSLRGWARRVHAAAR
ncbi:asparagine synthase (glutamine-hydrolyzing) [Magnetospirillum aberrantis]|uniref:asparagine synthase (glutamine-hydrolyzing) n=1 Tax=Magnetospirillum aberrantis SpK TaxID=908842 RepID=A0A7C9QVI5_9PROT|nr:asparagine synthase (glutamine-hydrolyzing) [Magnetospirillum aberrantis]NFV81598.1 asparagine synthase (glutamine-hydrolyzing) [Magnetospirillum aberrantis SpK]